MRVKTGHKVIVMRLSVVKTAACILWGLPIFPALYPLCLRQLSAKRSAVAKANAVVFIGLVSPELSSETVNVSGQNPPRRKSAHIPNIPS